jgi:hypothetical protein
MTPERVQTWWRDRWKQIPSKNKVIDFLLIRLSDMNILYPGLSFVETTAQMRARGEQPCWLNRWKQNSNYRQGICRL